MADGGLCSVCYNGSLELVEGMLVCDACGSIAQGFTQETQEFQTGISDARIMRRSRIAAKAKEAEPVKERAPLPFKEAVEAYALAVQQLLERLTAVMVNRLSISPLLHDVTKQLWFAYLPNTKILDPMFAQAIEAKMKATADDGINRLSIHHMATQAMEHELQRALPMHITLYILLLACWELRAPVNPLDITRWCLGGVLPYLRFGEDSNEVLKEYRKLITLTFVSPTGVPGPVALYLRSIEIAKHLELACPPINVLVWLERYVHELELPEVVLPAAVELYKLYRTTSPAFRLNHKTLFHPWVEVMALIVVAIKLLFGLDGKQRILPASWGQVLNWPAWAEGRIAKFESLLSHPEDVLKMTFDEYSSYLKNLEGTVFANFKIPEELNEAHELIHKLGEDINLAIASETTLRIGTDSSVLEGEVKNVPAGSYITTGLPYSFQVLALPGESAAVLNACAAHVWLGPQQLNESIYKLELDMLNAETGVQYEYDDIAQAKVLRMREEAARQRKLQQACLDAKEKLKEQLGL